MEFTLQSIPIASNKIILFLILSSLRLILLSLILISGLYPHEEMIAQQLIVDFSHNSVTPHEI